MNDEQLRTLRDVSYPQYHTNCQNDMNRATRLRQAHYIHLKQRKNLKRHTKTRLT